MTESFKTDQRRQITLAFVMITLLFFVILFGFSMSIRENGKRIDDIQESRLSSCAQTYQGILEVFTPYLPEHPTTEQQRRTVNKFKREIKALQNGCYTQTKPKG